MLSRNLSIIDKKYFYIEAAFIGFLLLLAERLKLVQISPEDFCQYYYAAKHFILNVPVYSAVPCARLIYPAQPPFADEQKERNGRLRYRVQQNKNPHPFLHYRFRNKIGNPYRYKFLALSC